MSLLDTTLFSGADPIVTSDSSASLHILGNQIDFLNDFIKNPYDLHGRC